MFKIKPGYDTVTKTMRMPELMVQKLERLAKENKVSFTSVVVQCLQYALDSISDDGKDIEKLCRKNNL